MTTLPPPPRKRYQKLALNQRIMILKQLARIWFHLIIFVLLDDNISQHYHIGNNTRFENDEIINETVISNETCIVLLKKDIFFF